MTQPVPQDLVEHWARGWARARTMPVEQLPGGWRFTMDHPERDAEIVAADPDPTTLRELSARAADEPRCWLSVIGAVPAGAVDGRLRLLTDQEVVMVSDALLPDERSADVPVEAAGGRARALLQIDGVLAASGTGAVSGEVLVLDQILTEPPFRRRGLGHRVVTALTAWGAENGCRTGVLAATPDGQGLYGALGWRVLAPMATWGP